MIIKKTIQKDQLEIFQKILLENGGSYINNPIVDPFNKDFIKVSFRPGNFKNHTAQWDKAIGHSKKIKSPLSRMKKSNLTK